VPSSKGLAICYKWGLTALLSHGSGSDAVRKQRAERKMLAYDWPKIREFYASHTLKQVRSRFGLSIGTIKLARATQLLLPVLRERLGLKMSEKTKQLISKRRGHILWLIQTRYHSS